MKLGSNTQSATVIVLITAFIRRAMERVHKRETLKNLTSLMKHLNLYKSSTKVGNLAIPNSVFTVLHSISLLQYIVLVHCMCFEHKYNLTIVSGGLCVSIGDSQAFLIYMCLTVHRSLIEDSICAIQAMVEERKFSFE